MLPSINNESEAEQFLRALRDPNSSLYEESWLTLRQYILRRATHLYRSYVIQDYQAYIGIEDVVQETLLSLFQGIHDIREPKNIMAYVYAVLRSRFSDRLRQRHVFESLDFWEDIGVLDEGFFYTSGSWSSAPLAYGGGIP
jgi:DNA-directed RNA polymerase specialized sigma24 family protein